MKRKPPGVVVLFNDCDILIKGEPHDILAEQGVVRCARAVAHAFERAGYAVATVPIQDKVEISLAPYPPTHWTIFNLGEGLEGRLFEEARIAWTLEAMGYQYTGASGDNLARSTNKARTKSILATHAVETPPWRVFRHPNEVRSLEEKELDFPLIVKPVAEDASIGVGPDAVVHTRQGLRERVAYVVERYRQAALAEAFVVGREFNIALWGDPVEVLPLAEIDFGAFSDPYTRIVSFAAKWEKGSFEYHHTPVQCPASVEPALATQIEETALRAWDAVGCQGYARVDMRVSEVGIPYVVEVNCNPDLSPDAGFFHAAQAAGYQYQDMVLHILEIARRQSYGSDRASFNNRWPLDFADDARDGDFYPHGAGLRRGAMESVSG
jgi:D-alanine-D-alanine ligase